MRYILFLGFCLATFGGYAQDEWSRQTIRKICGCFQVDFRYAETFAPDTSYRFHPRYHVTALELAYPEEESPRKEIIQHLLIVDDTTVIKHWREDWAFESREEWLFDHDDTWRHAVLPADSVRGRWTQTVWEVDDAPRYQGMAKWLEVDGKYSWQNTTDAPLPRREYTKRNDYNVMRRTNRIYATDSGWVHEQDNRKLVRGTGSPDREIAEEKGYNIYRRVDDTQCAVAAAWWRAHRMFWNNVWLAWAEALKDRQAVHLSSRVEGKYLFEELDALEGGGGIVSQAVLVALLDKYLR